MCGSSSAVHGRGEPRRTSGPICYVALRCIALRWAKVSGQRRSAVMYGRSPLSRSALGTMDALLFRVLYLSQGTDDTPYGEEEPRSIASSSVVASSLWSVRFRATAAPLDAGYTRAGGRGPTAPRALGLSSRRVDNCVARGCSRLLFAQTRPVQ